MKGQLRGKQTKAHGARLVHWWRDVKGGLVARHQRSGAVNEWSFSDTYTMHSGAENRIWRRRPRWRCCPSAKLCGLSCDQVARRAKWIDLDSLEALLSCMTGNCLCRASFMARYIERYRHHPDRHWRLYADGSRFLGTTVIIAGTLCYFLNHMYAGK